MLAYVAVLVAIAVAWGLFVTFVWRRPMPWWVGTSIGIVSGFVLSHWYL